MASTDEQENPYLPRSKPTKKGLATADLTAKEPLFGFLARKVQGAQVLKAMVR
jgi:hypothetical protein